MFRLIGVKLPNNSAEISKIGNNDIGDSIAIAVSKRIVKGAQMWINTHKRISTTNQ